MHDIVISGLRKSFGPNEVLGGIDLTIRSGEFVGLMGPNGAGKSTLIKILGGVYTRTSGDITYAGAPVRSLAERPEVGFIHQDLGLIDDLSIVDNLRLGEAPMRRLGPVLDGGRERRSAEAALQTVRLDRPVTTLVGELAPGEKTLVAVARLLSRGARVLFIDETTSTLPPQDANRLITTLRDTVASQGATVIMVSHKLSEILDATERIVVLLDGAIAADVKAAGLDRAQLVEMLVAAERPEGAMVHATATRGPERLRLEQACGGRAGPVDLALHAGEVVGLTGLAGSGLHDVGYLAYGAIRPRSGRVVRADGMRLALVPPHRESQGGFGDMSVQANLTISSLPDWRSRLRLVRAGAERADTEAMVRRLNVLPADPDAAFATLSGGNKQKVVFGRAVFRKPDVYVLCEPTRGVDVQTREALYDLIRGLRSEGAAVLLISSDSEDLFAVCDRIAVVEQGRLRDFTTIDEITPDALEAFI
ncbi:MAG: sugar transporter ATP-binding protein [Solirubrobacterales bacterium]|nr:sugar transporter ATP-binding protein [Solirubrobacterales bacterium]